MNDEVRKYVCKVIFFCTVARVTRTGYRDTVEQRNPREVVEGAPEASSFCGVGVKAGAIPESEERIPSSVGKLTCTRSYRATL